MLRAAEHRRRPGGAGAILSGLIVVFWTSTLWAQAADPAPATPLTTPAGKPPASQPAANVPGLGDVLNLVEKATADSSGAGAGDWSSPVKMAVVFTLLALLPSILVMMTAFTRIVIVLSFVRRALTTQSIPPNIAIIGLAMFLTLFTMAPVFGRINEQSMQPYIRGETTLAEAAESANVQLKDFMLRQTRLSDLGLFVEMAGIPAPETNADVPSYVAIPAFAVSEFRTAFEMGAMLFIPFILIDLVIASVLLSGGMMMLPPAMISLPFKIVLFVLVDGWRVLANTLVTSFN